MKNQNEIDVFRYPIKIIYQDYNINSSNYKTSMFDVSKVEYYDDLMFGEKFLARIFNQYLDFNVLEFINVQSSTNYSMFLINIRKIKLKKLLIDIK